MTYSAIEYAEAVLPIDPYVLGVWLGDGCSQHATITQGAQDYDFIRIEVEQCGHLTTDPQYRRYIRGYGYADGVSRSGADK